MKISHCEELKKVKKQELVPLVIDSIFTICKEDKHFSISENTKQLDKKIKLAEQKIQKQKDLLSQSNELKTDLQEKIKKLEDDTFSIKCRVLENLGSEI